MRRRANGEPQNLLTLSEKRRFEAALSPTSRASFRKILCWGRPGRGQCFSASVERSLSSFAWALRRLNLLQQPIFPTCRVPRLRTCRRAGPDSNLGGQVGYGMDSVRWRNLGASAFFSPPNSLTLDRGSGVIGGGQLGYNFQYNRLVFGIEGALLGAAFDSILATSYFPASAR